MRVLHVLNELRPSGAEVMLRAAAPYWARQGIQSYILSTGAVPGAYAKELKDAGFVVLHEPHKRSIWFFRAIHALIRRHTFDVVHIHTERANFWYGVIAHIAGVSCVVRTVHSVFRSGGVFSRKRRIERWLLRKLGMRFISISESVSAAESDHSRNPTRLIANWYDDSRYRPADEAERAAIRNALKIPDGAVVLAVVGNCATVKNHKAILHAMARLVTEHDLLLLHAGEESDLTERDLAARLGIADRIRFLGFCRDVAPVLHAADAFVMPSLREGLGNAAIEAIAAGRPVVLSDVDGLRDLRQLGGEIFWSGTDAESLELTLRQLLARPASERQRIGRDLADRVHGRFGSERGASEYATVYQEMMNARTGHARQIAAPSGTLGAESVEDQAIG